MVKRLLGTGLVALLSAGSAHAANCSAYSYTLTNGTTADANQVMGNFNSIMTCANTNLAPLASPRFTGAVGIGVASPLQALDLGSSTGKATNFELGPNGAYVSFNNYYSGGWVYRTSDYAYALADRGSFFAFFSFPSGTAGTIAPSNTTSLTFAGANVAVATTPQSYNFYVNGSAAGTGTWINASDARLKKNVQPLSNGLDLVKRLNPVSFNWRAATERSVGKTLTLPVDERQIGFIAQEVEKVIPEAVSKPKGADAIYGLKEESLIPVLVAAIKEQQAEIEQLRASLAALKH